MNNHHERIIFLDHDDVICLQSNWGSRAAKLRKYKKQVLPKDREDPPPVYYRFDHFDEKAVRTLNAILESTGAQIVVTSTWRSIATVDEMGEYYERYGIIRKPVDFTREMEPVEPVDNKDSQRVYSMEYIRAVEILDYLSSHPEIKHWVAIDDLNLQKYPDAYIEHFVITDEPREGIKRIGVKERVLSFFPEI
jgi:hypothetical protein